MKNPPRLVPKGRALRRRRRSRRQTAASAMTLPWTLSSQALYLLRVWHKHLPNGHLNGHGISVAPYKPARHAKEQRAQQAAAATAACPHHAAPAIFEIRIAEFMLCVPQSEAVASALLVPMSNTHTQTNRPKSSLENETEITKTLPRRKVSSDFRWGLLGRLRLLWRPAMRLCLNLDGHVGDSFWLASSSSRCKWRAVQSIRLEIMLNISFQICDWALTSLKSR